MPRSPFANSDRSALQNALVSFVASRQTDAGRPLSQLVKTNETLQGDESQRLRTFCTSECMEPSRDLDEYGGILFLGKLDLVKADYEKRVKSHAGSATPDATHRAAAVSDLYALRWGPTLVPIYNLLLLGSIILPASRPSHLSVVKYLISINVPVDGIDLSGTHTLSHAISTKPSFDSEFAQLLFDAGADINSRSRYGDCVGHSIMMTTSIDPVGLTRSRKALRWYLEHGGDLDIRNEGLTPRSLVRNADRLDARMSQVVKDFESNGKKSNTTTSSQVAHACSFCGKDDVQILRCSACKEQKYCLGRQCQKLDWPKHKKTCKKIPAA